MWGYYCEDCEQYTREKEIEAAKYGEFYCKPVRRNVRPKEHSCNVYFKQRDNKCYITTAMCHILGMDDDCETLEILRGFRDNYMKKHEECLPLLKDYDVVGPMIAESLYTDKENGVTLATIVKNNFIKDAIEQINDKAYGAAIKTYKNMTFFLMDCYDISEDLLPSKQIKENKGIQRKRETK